MKWIFVGGCPRSGTTLIASLIGRLQGVLTVPESQFKRDLAIAATFDFAANQAALENSLPFRMWRLGDGYLGSLHADVGLRELLDGMARAFALRSGWRSEPDFVVDHTPSNMRNDISASLAKIFPEALFVHVVRDPRGVVNSIRRADWGPTAIAPSTDWWLTWTSSTCTGAAERATRGVTVRYEDVLADPATALTRLGRFIGIPETRVLELGAGHSDMALESSRACAWLHELPRFAPSEIARRAGREARLLGYDIPDPGRKSHLERLAIGCDGLVSAMRSATTQRLAYRRRRGSVVRSLSVARRTGAT